MSEHRYVFIETRDPFQTSESGFVAETAAALRRRGRPVAVFLVQNGVLAARAGARGSTLGALTAAGVDVLADDFSLRERGIEARDMTPGVRESSVGALVDLIVQPGTKAVWH
jgi:sulfur transfer complex TusBCD TusB component (DsrH family)